MQAMILWKRCQNQQKTEKPSVLEYQTMWRATYIHEVFSSDFIGKNMADGVGFEPTEGANPRWFSRPVLSTTQPPIHKKHLCLRLIS